MARSFLVPFRLVFVIGLLIGLIGPLVPATRAQEPPAETSVALEEPAGGTTEDPPAEETTGEEAPAAPEPVDTDGDGSLDGSDNCLDTSNPGQEDLDGDGAGDACDTDVDGDLVDDTVDNCPGLANGDQADSDSDGPGDACDPVEEPAEVPNSAPTASGNHVETGKNQAVTIDLFALGLVADADGDPLAVTASQGEFGAVTVDGGILIYTPADGFSGSDAFVYAVDDGRGGIAEATITVDVVNAPPVATDGSAATTPGEPVEIAIVPNFAEDPDGDDLDIIETDPAGDGENGSIVDNGDGTLTYTPEDNFTGTDTFTFAVADDSDATDSASISVAVEAVGPPDLRPTAFSGPQGVNLPAAGATVSLTWTVINEGGTTATVNWIDRVWLSSDATLGSGDTPLQFLGHPDDLIPGDDYDATFAVLVPRPFALSNPATATPTTYYLILRTDDTMSVAESDEADNVLVHAIKLTPVFADLHPTAFNAPDTLNVPAAGAQITLTWSVLNEGPDIATSTWIDRIWLSTDATLGAGDTPLQFLSHAGPLASGADYDSSLLVTVPRHASISTPATAGPTRFYLLLRIDDNAIVPEGDEADNTWAHPIILTAVFPDLHATAFNAPDSLDVPAAGASMTLTWSVLNEGADIATINWIDRVWLSTDDTLGSGDTPLQFLSHPDDLAPGADYDASLLVTVPRPFGISTPAAPGPTRYYLLLRIDDGAFVAEADKVDNIWVHPIILTSVFPDLRPTTLTGPGSVDLPAAGVSVSLSWSAINEGADIATINWIDRVWLSTDPVLGSGDTQLPFLGHSDDLAAGDSYSGSFSILVPRPFALSTPATAAPTVYYLLLRIDDGNFVAEADDTDNVWVHAITLNPVFPDLRPTALSGPGALDLSAAGASVPLSWSVINEGADIATINWIDRIWLSTDETLGSGDTQLPFLPHSDDIAPGESYSASLTVQVPRPFAMSNPATASPTTYYLLVRIDDGNFVAETDDTDNVRAHPITFTPVFPDLLPTGLTTPNRSVSAGQAINVTWTVTNSGQDLVPTPWNDTIWLSTNDTVGGDPFVSSVTPTVSGPLDPGESYTQTATITIPSSTAIGKYYLILETDRGGARPESNETNNTLVLRIAVGNRTPTANAGGPYPVPEGALIPLAGTGSDPDGDPLTYTWDLNDDGTFETSGQNPAFSAGGLDGPSTHTVRLRVCDDFDACATSLPATVTVFNVGPAVEPPVGAPAGPGEGDEVVISAAFTDPFAGDAPFTCTVDFGDGSGSLEGDVESTVCTGPAHVYADDGVYTVTVTVSDKDGGTGSASVVVTVSNAAPIADAGGPYSVPEGGWVTLSGSGTDPGGDELTLQWDFDGDGDFDDEGPTPAFPAAGLDGPASVTVRLKVCDDGTPSLCDEAEATVDITNAPPVITAVTSDGADEGGTATIAVSATDPGGDSLVTELDCDNDGAFEIQGDTCAFGDDGEYPVVVRVTDDDGAADTAALTVTVRNLPPAASAGGPYEIGEGEPVVLDGSGSDYTGDTLTFAWDLDGDGAFDDATGHRPTFNGTDGPATYAVGLRVCDDDNACTDSSATTIDVLNLEPEVSAGSNETIEIGAPFTRTGSFTDPGADTWSATVDYGDGMGEQALPLGPDNTFTFTHAYIAAGSFTVTVTVTDDDGARGSASFAVTVVSTENRDPVVDASFQAGSVACGADNATLAISISDPDGGTHGVVIDWGDSSAPETFADVDGSLTASHTYSASGQFTATVTATDPGGRAGSDTADVTVTYVIEAPLSPIREDGTSRFNNRSTIPVKVRVTGCDGSLPTDLELTISINVLSGSAPNGEINQPLSTSAADTTGVLRYTGSDGIYIYNLSAGQLNDPSATYEVVITITETGQTATATFGIK